MQANAAAFIAEEWVCVVAPEMPKTLHPWTALYAHPEDALKKTPETFNKSGDVKIEDAPGGPWTVGYERGALCLVVKHPGRRPLLLATDAEAIAVRDALNREVRDKRNKNG